MMETLPKCSRQIGPYRIEEQLGRGGMGAVFRAHDERLERQVALKQILPEALQSPLARRRFRREARCAARLSHPSIVKIHDFLELEGGDWIVMELVIGESLEQILRRGPLALEKALLLAIEITDALTTAHAEGIVHRDLKASNILVIAPDRSEGLRTLPGRIKILDFGLAKQLLTSREGSTSVTLDGQVLGTPEAMSPEQAMGRPVTLCSDIFSLGVLIDQMITGTPPFRAENPVETLSRVCLYQPPSLSSRHSNVPKALSRLVGQMLEKDPAQRPQSAAEIARHLRTIADGPLIEGFDAAGRTGSRPAEAGSVTLSRLGRAEEIRPRSLRSGPRQVTVLCCELASPDSPSHSIDPEALVASTTRLEHLARKLSQTYEGYLASALGHRLMIYFGFPRAQEDAARRALSFAIELEESFSESTSPRPLRRRVRSAIHTMRGLAFCDFEGREQLALGQELDRLNQLCRIIPPGEVWISEKTRSLLRDGYEFEPREAPGFWKDNALGERTYVAAKTPTLTGTRQMLRSSILARDNELECLHDFRRRARGGEGHIVLVRGEAGIGKSRLIEAFLEQTARAEFSVLCTAGLSFARHSPFRPMIDLLHRAFDLSPEASQELQFERLVDGLANLLITAPEDQALLAEFLEIPSGSSPPIRLSPAKQREATCALVQELVLSLSRQQPLILVIEDLHWADPSTLELLSGFIDRVATSSLLLVLTYRPSFEPEWPELPHQAWIDLPRLSRAATADLILQVTRGRSLPKKVRDQILSKTDGVPLFVEELTKSLLESEILVEAEGRFEIEGKIDDLKVPATLRDSLDARLDRLGAAKEVAQLAAVVGREVSHSLLAAVASTEESFLHHQLEALLQSEILVRRGFSTKRRYAFRHALIQEAAYETLLQSQRQEIHGDIARALEERFAEVTAGQPEILAHHYTEAGRFEPALDYWLKAGQRNVGRSAALEARDHLTRGLSVLDQSPLEGFARDRRELTLRSTLAVALSAIEGFASSSVGESHIRTVDLVRRTGEDLELFTTQWGLWAFYISRAEYGKAQELAQTLLALARDGENPSFLVATLYAAGFTSYCLGRFPDAASDFEETVNILETGCSLELEVGLDFEIAIRSTFAPVCWHLGDLDRAIHHSHLALRRARELVQPMLPLALIYGSHLDLLRGEFRAARSKSREALTISESQGLFTSSIAKLLLGWSHVMASTGGPWTDHLRPEADPGIVSEGIRTLREGLAEAEKTGHELACSPYCAALAEGYALSGETTKAIELLDATLENSHKTREAFWDAELWRLRGTFIGNLGPGRATEAHENLETARRIAYLQGTKSFESRAIRTLREAGYSIC